MNPRPYTHLLDEIAADHLPAQVQLAPAILARVQKMKAARMKPALRILYAAILLAAVFAILFFTVPEVRAAVQRWFGYVPEIGLIHDGQIRVLAEPASETRDGVTVTVEQAFLNREQTTLVYSVRGLPDSATVNHSPGQPCEYRAALVLPDGGDPIMASPRGLGGAYDGYAHRLDYAALPPAVESAELQITCLFNALSGAAPEDWRLPLRFVPAPADITVFPVIEIPTARAPASTPSDSVSGKPLSLSLIRAVPMEDGYLLYAALGWEGTLYGYAEIVDPAQTFHLRDTAGRELPFEMVEDDQTGLDFDHKRQVFALKTPRGDSGSPLALSLDAALVQLPVSQSFVFDPGPAAQSGQVWQLEKEFTFGDRELTLHSITAENGGYSFDMSSRTGIRRGGFTDHEHPIVSGFDGESTHTGDEYYFFNGFSYQDGLPAGPITLWIEGIGVRVEQSLRVDWTPPAAEALPPEPSKSACLTWQSWQSAQTQPAPIPPGLPGRVLVYGSMDSNNPNGAWEMAAMNLDGSERLALAGERGTLSPDGLRVAYSTLSDGIVIKDLAGGAVRPLPGTRGGDSQPFWSTDSAGIVYNRGMGIFDLYQVRLDGSGEKRLTTGGGQEIPLGWLDDGSLLYSVTGESGQNTIYRILPSGESQEFSKDDIRAISTDGRYAAGITQAVGGNWQVFLSDLESGVHWPLNSPDLSVLAPYWSPDGQWMLVTVLDPDGGPASGALVNLVDCRVIPLPALQDDILGWIE
jgi:hypothetical protein